MEEVRVDVMYRVRMRVVRVQNGPFMSLRLSVEFPTLEKEIDLP